MTEEAIWLGLTPTADDLEGMPLAWFHQAVDDLVDETIETTDGPA
jgi:hypothetical protein